MDNSSSRLLVAGCINIGYLEKGVVLTSIRRFMIRIHITLDYDAKKGFLIEILLKLIHKECVRCMH